MKHPSARCNKVNDRMRAGNVRRTRNLPPSVDAAFGFAEIAVAVLARHAASPALVKVVASSSLVDVQVVRCSMRERRSL